MPMRNTFPGRNGPSKKSSTTTATTTTTRKFNFFRPLLTVKFIPPPTRKEIMTTTAVRETMQTPDFPPTPDDIWIQNFLSSMRGNTTETPLMPSMTTSMSFTTTPYREDGMSSFGDRFKNESTDFSSSNKEPSHSVFDNTAVIAAISVIAALIIVCVFVAVILWRRRKATKFDSKENSFPYQSDAVYSTPDKHLQTISGPVGACYAKENDYCRLENNANKKIENENNYKPKIVWSTSKISDTEADPPYADYSTVFSGKV